MAHYSLTHLIALLDSWDKLQKTCTEAQGFNDSLSEDQIAYFEGMALGVETTRNELAAIIALMIVESNELSPSLM